MEYRTTCNPSAALFSSHVTAIYFHLMSIRGGGTLSHLTLAIPVVNYLPRNLNDSITIRSIRSTSSRLCLRIDTYTKSKLRGNRPVRSVCLVPIDVDLFGMSQTTRWNRKKAKLLTMIETTCLMQTHSCCRERKSIFLSSYSGLNWWSGRTVSPDACELYAAFLLVDVNDGMSIGIRGTPVRSPPLIGASEHALYCMRIMIFDCIGK